MPDTEYCEWKIDENDVHFDGFVYIAGCEDLDYLTKTGEIPGECPYCKNPIKEKK